MVRPRCGMSLMRDVKFNLKLWKVLRGHSWTCCFANDLPSTTDCCCSHRTPDTRHKFTRWYDRVTSWVIRILKKLRREIRILRAMNRHISKIRQHHLSVIPTTEDIVFTERWNRNARRIMALDARWFPKRT